MQTLHFSNRTDNNKLHIPSLGVALVLLICLASPASSCTAQEKGSLLQFLAELSRDGGLAASWRNGTDCCKWDGITCDRDKTVTAVLLSSQGLKGHISPSLGILTRLQHLDLSHNSLSGGLPLELVWSSSITILDVSFNQLNGTLDELPSSTPVRPLQVLNISSNLLTGPFPSTTWKAMENLITLNASNNSFTGQIPSEFCNSSPSFTVLDLCFNQFSGRIPPGLGSCSKLRVLKAGRNNLSGTLPDELFNANSLECLSFPKNGLQGTLEVRMKESTAKNRRENNEDAEVTSFYSGSEQTLVMMRMPQGKGDENKLKFTDILKATNNFDKENVIGCGGYGLVYKAELTDGSILAIKKLNSEMCLMEREFSAEVDALSMAQHENLVPLWGYCIQGNSRFLVYSYMENGSLDDWLHNSYDDASSFLDWPTRLKIAQGASLGLSYIHDVCNPQIVHRDIKSSNILLDKEFKAYVADFGLARLILPNQTHVSTELAGTMGYIPPEYGQSWVATLRGDMYSFGVVLLELLTGMRPVPVLSTSKELVPWVLQMRSEGKQVEVLDPTLRGTGYEEQMLKVLEAACKCVNHNQFMRPTIMEVVSCLDSIDADLQM
ncbi:hypothetical protein QYE76_037639 [Lolium multiflorum]|uniref:non-specific serine/threonine protein kinase n=1 Tax=Lolium multiflorum TaxID=4521 RepID=A0AAD8QFY4_LOLMU|nr:hypothetical protein QYE76_037639 [Lolium multiflorum]